MIDRRTKNAEIFRDTERRYTSDQALVQAVRQSIESQVFIAEKTTVDVPAPSRIGKTKVIVSGKRSLEAADSYVKQGKKVCVLNFASATNPGGGVVNGSSAQEECICRCTTLYPCLNTDQMWKVFYRPHRKTANPLYNNDCIYTPNVCVFKSDTNFPEPLAKENWWSVNFLTCAAPNLRERPSNMVNPHAGDKAVKITPLELEKLLTARIRRIFEIAVSQITAGTLEKFYSHLKSDGRLVRREIYGEGLANSVIRSIHAHCRASLEKAKVEGLIRQNPAVHCKLPPKKSAEVEVLTVEEMQRLLIQAKEEGFYEMFLLDLSTGLRRGELLALMWDDINLETGELKVNKQVRYFNKELHIMPPKTKAAYRTIILPLPLIEMLKEYCKKVRSKWLFPSPYKREQDLPRDPCACRKKLSQILEHAGCKQVPFHALRHTFATQALRYGMDVKTLACTIGHESVETTLNVYSHATDEGMRTAAKTIDKTIGSLAGAYAEFEGGESEDEQVRPKPPNPRQGRNLSLIKASTDGREQARSTRSARTYGKDGTRQS